MLQVCPLFPGRSGFLPVAIGMDPGDLHHPIPGERQPGPTLHLPSHLLGFLNTQFSFQSHLAWHLAADLPFIFWEKKCERRFGLEKMFADLYSSVVGFQAWDSPTIEPVEQVPPGLQLKDFRHMLWGGSLHLKPTSPGVLDLGEGVELMCLIGAVIM